MRKKLRWRYIHAEKAPTPFLSVFTGLSIAGIRADPDRQRSVAERGKTRSDWQIFNIYPLVFLFAVIPGANVRWLHVHHVARPPSNSYSVLL